MPTTIYFSGSISGGRADLETYRFLVDALRAAGHRVLAGSVASEEVSDHGDAVEPREISARDRGWIDESDVLVAEVSMPSIGVGYEIAYARWSRRIPVICLYRPAYTKRCSAMVSGDPGIELITYDGLEGLVPRLVESIRQVRRLPDRLP